MVDLIPREVLFGNPQRMTPRLSPDGTRLAYIAPDEGVLNVWLRTVGKDDDRPVTRDRGRGIHGFFWAQNGEQILYVQDRDGDENWRIYAVGLEGGEPVNLTPLEEVQAQILAVDQKFPDEILIALNDRVPELHDVYRVHLRTGERTLAAVNDLGAAAWGVDHDFRVRAAVVPQADGSFVLLVRDTPESDWRELKRWEGEDTLTTGLLGFAEDGEHLLLSSSVGSNTSQLRRVNPADGSETVVASDPEADLDDILAHPTRYHVQAVAFTKARREWKVLDPDIAPDFEALARVHDGDFAVVNRDRADRHWLVAYEQDRGPVLYYGYDRGSRQATFLFSHRPDLEGLPLVEMRPVEIRARDGLTLHGYLSVPVEGGGKGLPAVLNVHGGPWHRDVWGYDPEAQWLANRGYAVLQVNFRSSTGYGKDFVNAGDREWGGKMQDDLTDAVRWLVDEGIADPERVAIFGGSYGGYAVLAGLTFTPELYACGVDIVGPSSLFTFMETIPPYWKPFEALLYQRVGHPEEDAELLRARSPLFHVDRIQVPLLIAQGANDPRVKRSESLQIVDALDRAGKKVEYVEYDDEGHGFARPENRLDFYARAERFLAEHLGGRCEEA